jgi:hypothetical protein
MVTSGGSWLRKSPTSVQLFRSFDFISGGFFPPEIA